MSGANEVVVFAGKPNEAGRLRSLLEAAGIPAFLRDEHIATLRPGAVAGAGLGLVKVVVPASFSQRAAEVLPERRHKS